MGICILERWWEERLRDDYESLEESQDWLPISRDWNYLFCYVRLVLGFPSNPSMGLIDLRSWYDRKDCARRRTSKVENSTPS